LTLVASELNEIVKKSKHRCDGQQKTGHCIINIQSSRRTMVAFVLIGLFIVWFFIARWLARMLTRSVNNEVVRRLLAGLTVMFLLILPLADEIVGGFQFRALCRENAVLKVDAEKIKGKTIRVVIDPANKDVDNTAIRIYFSHLSYLDVVTNEELASYSWYVAKGGMLIRALAMGHEMPPMTFSPSCSGSLPESYGFKLIN
jgi:hypothetical protein